MSKKHKESLGDAVYVDWDGYHVILTVSDGVYDTDRILLNDQSMEQLINYYERLNPKDNESRSDTEG